MFLLGKLLPEFVLPLGVSLMLITWGLLRGSRRAIWAGVGMLLCSSNSWVGDYLIRTTENWAERRPAAETQLADAIVVLSAGRTQAPGRGQVSEWGDADRFFGGVELFQAGKAKWLIFTGGWSPREPDSPLEGEVLALHARRLGLPAEQIVVTGRAANTLDEVREVSLVLQRLQITPPRILLVTSAFHIPRARQLFEQQDFTVEPFPVDFGLSQRRQRSVLDLMPSVGALGQTHSALRELYGRAFYWLRDQF